MKTETNPSIIIFKEDRETISKKLLMTTNTTDYNSIMSLLNNGSNSKQFLSY